MKVVSVVMFLLGLVGFVATAASDTVQSFWAAHSTLAPLVLLVYAKVGLFMPSPATKPQL